MNISATTYPDFQPGIIATPVLNQKMDDTEQPAQFSGNDAGLTRVEKQGLNPPPAQPGQIDSNPDDDNATDPEKGGDALRKTPGSEKGQTLTSAEIQLLEDLKQADREVRQHEMAHIAAGGRYITSGVNFTYKRGPDGNNYAVQGEVGIDTSQIPGDPKATLQKMAQVANAALAPVDPSPQDLKVASQARAAASKAMSDLMQLQTEQRAAAADSQVTVTAEKAKGSYEKVENLPEGETTSFQIAV